MLSFPSILIESLDLSSAEDKIDQICQQLDNKISPNNPDIFIINSDTGWSIDLVRNFKNFFIQKPFNHKNKIGIIYQIDKLNIESQNALLKILEEPGLNNFIILTTTKKTSLIPTIISRCHLIKVFSEAKKIFSQSPIKISGDFSKDTNNFDYLYQNKEKILPFLNEQIVILQSQLSSKPQKSISILIQKIIKAINMINANVDPRSALDYVFLN